MNREWKKKWIETLRSGKYKQGQRELRNGDHFCCLGVLCDLVDSTGWEPAQEGFGYYYQGTHKDGTPHARSGFLTDNVAAETGLSRDDQERLVELNDRKSFNFNEIAQYIEERL